MGDEKTITLMDIILERLPFIGKADTIDFHSHGSLTLGVEIELQIIDPITLNLASRAVPLLKAGGHIKGLKAEIYQSMVEINTTKCNNVQDIEADLTESLAALHELGQKQDILFATTGCHPYSRYADNIVSNSTRYQELLDRNQWISRRITIFSTHVHIGMKSGEDFIRFNNFFLHFMPHLVALSASSPFWQGEDTGLMACRPCIFESLPTAGQPYKVNNWQEFESLYQTLRKCNSIRSLKDLWWDMRPSPSYGTLEIRICDGTASLAETTAIVAYIHLLAHWFNDNGDWINYVPTPQRWLSRENKWRAMRYGLDAELVLNMQGETKPIRKDIEDWLHKTAKYRETLDYGKYIQTLRQILANGNSSHRQRRVFEETGSLQTVVRHNIDEFESRHPIWEKDYAQVQPQPLLTEIIPAA